MSRVRAVDIALSTALSALNSIPVRFRAHGDSVDVTQLRAKGGPRHFLLRRVGGSSSGGFRRFLLVGLAGVAANRPPLGRRSRKICPWASSLDYWFHDLFGARCTQPGLFAAKSPRGRSSRLAER